MHQKTGERHETLCRHLHSSDCSSFRVLCRQGITHVILKELNRPALHAKTLGFIHPLSLKRLHFTSELPQDLQRALFALRGL